MTNKNILCSVIHENNHGLICINAFSPSYFEVTIYSILFGKLGTKLNAKGQPFVRAHLVDKNKHTHY